MKTINRFMCFKVITGSYIVAVFCIVIALLFFLNSLSGLKSSVYEENRKIIKETEFANGDKLVIYDTMESEINKWGYSIDLIAQSIVISLYVAFVLGVITRDINLMIPAIAICAVSILAYPLSILLMNSSPLRFLGAYLLGHVLYYCFVTLYSAYVQICHEKSATFIDQQGSSIAATNP